MKYFKQFHNRPANSVTISDSNIYVPTDTYKLIVDSTSSIEVVDKVNLFYNDQTNQLKIIPNFEGTNKIVKAKGNYYRISSKISQVLVPGIYVWSGAAFSYLRQTTRRKP